MIPVAGSGPYSTNGAAALAPAACSYLDEVTPVFGPLKPRKAERRGSNRLFQF